MFSDAIYATTAAGSDGLNDKNAREYVYFVFSWNFYNHISKGFSMGLVICLCGIRLTNRISMFHVNKNATLCVDNITILN